MPSIGLKIHYYPNILFFLIFNQLGSFCFVALRPKSTAMVIAGRSVHLTTLFPGQAEQAANQYFVHILSLITNNQSTLIRFVESFAIIVLQMYCYYNCSKALPHGAVGWSAVCDCGIS